MANFVRTPDISNGVDMGALAGAKRVQALEDFSGYGYATDFVEHVPAGTALSGWVVTAVNTSTVASADEVGGAITILSDTAENDGLQAQQSEIYKPTAGTDIVFSTKVKLLDVLASDLFVGLAKTDTTILASNPDAMCGFILADGAADLKYIVRDAGVGAAADTGVNLVNNTYVVLGMKVYGTTKVEFFVDGEKVATVTTNIPTENVALSIAFLTGDASANSVTLDNVVCFQSR